MGAMHLRALRNGAVAALITALIGFAINGLFAADGSEGATGTSPVRSPTPACRPKVDVVARSGFSGLSGRFSDLWLDSADDGWAVGGAGTGDTVSTAVLARWDGLAWMASTDTPDVGTADALEGVDGVDTRDVWAVGWSSDGLGKDTLAAHYDGTSWTVTTSPPDGRLYDVRALAPDDVWAVGSAGDPDFVEEKALAIHWDGRVWTEASVPAGGGRSGLYAIAGTDGDLWAAGYNHHGPLLMHFDGTSWRRVSGIDARGPLWAVAVVKRTVWLAGSSVLRGDGTTFTDLRNARTGGAFTDLAAVSPSSAFAVGVTSAGGGSRSLAVQIDGDTTRPARVRASGQDELDGVALVDGEAWMGGWHRTPRGELPLVATLRGC
ncbi:MAG TPA: hypothetical protein VHM47_06920 [Actinomycetota bacterium]|nr:hypothetical protein [Actinomycetota bacterium]